MFDTVPIPLFDIGPMDFSMISNRSGLEIMQGMMDGQLPAPTMAQTMTTWIHEVREGYTEFRGEPGTQHMNPLGLVHGGWAMSMLDSALGCAVHTTCAPGEGFVSMDTQVKFIRPILPTTGQVRAIAQVQTRGRKVANVEGRIEDREGKILALGTSTCFIQPHPGA